MQFLKESWDGLSLEGPKSLKNAPKIRFLGFKKFYLFKYAFLLQYHGANGLYN